MFRNRTAVAVAFVIGILVLGGLVGMSSMGSTTVSAAQIGSRGGATESELNFALNFRKASNAEMFGTNGVRNFDGAESAANAIDGQVAIDLENAVRAIGQLPCEAVESSSLGGKTFGAGVYCLASADLAGSMTLDGGGDTNARFVFRISGDMTAAAGSTIAVENGANALNAYFVAGDEVTIGDGSHFAGTFVAGGNINLGAGADLRGKALSVKGEVNASEANIAAQTGFVEVCKELAAGEVTIAAGTLFTFDVAGQTVTAPAGASAPRTEVASGNVTITEVAQANVAVVNIRTEPTSRLVSSNLGLRQAVVAVPAGDFASATLVFFRNQTTRTGSLEICKYGLDADVTGSFFFTVQGVPAASNNFSVPVGFCSDIITTTLPVGGLNPTTFPVIVTELARPTFRLEAVDTLPTGLNAPLFPGFVPNQGFNAAGNPIPNTDGGYTTVTLNTGVTPSTANMVLVNFYNRSLPGRIKICKFIANLPTPGNPQILTTTRFLFTVVGQAPSSPTQTMPGFQATVTGVEVYPNSCTIVPGTWIVGTSATVTETGWIPGTGQTLTFADTRVSRIAANPASALTAFSLANRTATLTIRNALVEVDFTNFIFRPAIVKLCKAGGPGVTGTASFTLSLVNPLTSWAVSTTPIVVPVNGCTIINGPFPGITPFPIPNTSPVQYYGTFNLGTQLTITEAAVAGQTLTSITSPTGNTVTTAGLAGTITLNQAPNNINEIRFLNSLTPVASADARYDFDGDGTSDMAIYRSGTWWYAASGSNLAQTAIQFGAAGDKLVAADYDGDSKTDAAVYRDGTWFVLGSTQGLMQLQFGLATDIPQPGDYDGDGKADFAVYRPSDGVWYMQRSTAGFGAIQFGISSDKPVSADFDGDGRTDQAVYRSGTWFVMGSTAGFYGAQFGIASDLPVQADFDGDNKADMAVYRAGTWHVLGSTAGYYAAQFGVATDTPVPADYDGDGKTDLAVYRTSTTVWHILKSSQAQTLSGGYVAAQFGSSNDVLMNY